MPSIESNKEKIRKLLTCPVNWTEVFTEHLGLINLLVEYWGELVLEYQVRDEGEYVKDDLFSGGLVLETDDDEDLLEGQIDAIESWVDEARREYIERTSIFTQLKMADRKKYPKHFPNRVLSKSQVQEASTSGISIFYSGVTDSDLMDLVWRGLPCRCNRECKEDCDGPWRRLLQKNHIKIYVKANEPMGASKGLETAVVCFDFDCNTPEVHGYPILEEDVLSEIITPNDYHKTWKDLFVTGSMDGIVDVEP